MSIPRPAVYSHATLGVSGMRPMRCAAGSGFRLRVRVYDLQTPACRNPSPGIDYFRRAAWTRMSWLDTRARDVAALPHCAYMIVAAVLELWWELNTGRKSAWHPRSGDCWLTPPHVNAGEREGALEGDGSLFRRQV